MPKPVIVLPGYYGTLLVDSVAKKTIWLTLNGLLHSGDVLEAIRLDSSDPSRIVSGDIFQELEIFPFWSPNIYKDLLMFLGSIGYSPSEVVAFGVDWRRSIDFTIDNLHHKITATIASNNTDKVNIIAHSHGGLVARAYLAKYGPAAVENFITLGTPHKGMLSTFKALAEGISFLGFSPSHISKVARTFPSAYELLPSDADDGLFVADGENADPFTHADWAFDDTSKLMIAAAGHVVRSLPAKLPVKTTMIFGTHGNTLALAEENANGTLRFFENDDGDTTVPRVSASGSGMKGKISRFGLPYAIHSRLFEYEATKRLLKNVLLDRPMPHFAFAFEKEMYRPGDRLGIGVDVRDPHGVPLIDADVDLKLHGGAYRVDAMLEPDDDDFFGLLQMPDVPVHLQYSISVRHSSLSVPIEQSGMLWAST